MISKLVSVCNISGVSHHNLCAALILFHTVFNKAVYALKHQSRWSHTTQTPLPLQSCLSRTNRGFSIITSPVFVIAWGALTYCINNSGLLWQKKESTTEKQQWVCIWFCAVNIVTVTLFMIRSLWKSFLALSSHLGNLSRQFVWAKATP